MLVLAFVLGGVNASSNSFLGQRQDETTVGASPKYAIMHETAKAEEEVYWSRLMQETTMSVAPMPTPPLPTLETPMPHPPTNPAPSPKAITQGPTSSPVEDNKDDCDPNPCLNGGTCKDRDNSFTCTCVDGFVGDKCEIPGVILYKNDFEDLLQPVKINACTNLDNTPVNDLYGVPPSPFPTDDFLWWL